MTAAMTRSEHILEAARTIRSELQQLLGAPEAAQIDCELAQLLAEANAGRMGDADIRILHLLQEHDSTLEWVSAYLRERLPKGEAGVQGTRAYAPLPGAMAPIAAGVRYRCPHNDYVCDYVWHRRAVGAVIPVCPTHHVELRPDP